MEMYNVFEHGNAEAYLVQGTESFPHFTNPALEQLDVMHNEGAQEFVVEQGLYYPAATDYGYICTGFEPPADWDDHHTIFGLDGQEVQCAGAQTEGLPYVYYTPSYGYAQSPYNPYNPYIPGAMIGVDGQFVGTQQYYTVPYETPLSSPAYLPMVVQSGPEIIASSTPEPFIDGGPFTAYRSGGPGLKSNLSSASVAFTRTPTMPASNQTCSFSRVTECPKVNGGPSKLPAARGNVTSSSISGLASSPVQGMGVQTVDSISHGKAYQPKLAVSSNNGLSNYGSSIHGLATAEKLRPKFQDGSLWNDVNGGSDALIEQNGGSRIDKSRSHLSVKAYTTRAGESDSQGNIVIYTDEYNKDDFPIDYLNAKFFVIKSYSEDDVHKSIKYNVWSSTPNGNKKLQCIYEDTQRIAAGYPRCCPVFLFFSVNASGQFCGVAEMTGPVDFRKDMDFWQQDKWSGSFPVKWHIIKDLPNPNFRHIILENNENKPVTNSRDTQEIWYKQGVEMLKIFKNYTLRTSLLDDFMYYENRQKIMQDEKARFRVKSSYVGSFIVPALDPPRKQTSLVDIAPCVVEKTIRLNSMEKRMNSITDQVSLVPDVSSSNIFKKDAKHIAGEAKHDDDDDVSSSLKTGSLTINPKQTEIKPLEISSNVGTMDNTTKPVDIVTVGSMPIRVNGSPGFGTVGSFLYDPRALQVEEAGRVKRGS